MTLRLVTRPSGLLIPVDDLGIKGTLPGQLILGDDLPFVLALNAGFDGNQSRLLKVDALGNLRIGSVDASLATLPAVGGSSQLAGKSYAGTTWNPFGNNWLLTVAWMTAYNGGFPQTLGSASQAELGSQQSLRALMTAAPGQWAVNHNPGAGTAASASRAAAGGNTRHVCTGVSFGWSATVALAAITTLTINLRDGASGAGTILAAWQFTLPAAVIASFLVVLTGLSLVGSVNTAMTLEGSAGIGNLLESANLFGYDAP